MHATMSHDQKRREKRERTPANLLAVVAGPKGKSTEKLVGRALAGAAAVKKLFSSA